MKNKSFLMISVIMVCSLTACGQQETGIMTKTGNSTEQVVAIRRTVYRTAMYAAVKSTNPNWKPGQKFDTSILDNVKR